jgi:hypothetical protein
VLVTLVKCRIDKERWETEARTTVVFFWCGEKQPIREEEV